MRPSDISRGKRRIIAAIVSGVIVIFLTAGIVTFQRSNHRHEWWHECRDNCWLLDDSKKLYAEQPQLAAGVSVTWSDIEPYFANSQYWGMQHPSPTGMP